MKKVLLISGILFAVFSLLSYMVYDRWLMPESALIGFPFAYVTRYYIVPVPSPSAPQPSVQHNFVFWALILDLIIWFGISWIGKLIFSRKSTKASS
jgi:hypothetical protein